MASSRNLLQPGFEVACRRSEPAAAHAGLPPIAITLDVRDPVGRIVDGRYALVEKAAGERLAVLEMSSASGFSLVRGNDSIEVIIKNLLATEW
jgi:hypothetical protein